MKGLGEREYSTHWGLSRGAIQKAKQTSRMVMFAGGSTNATASDARRAEMVDPDQQRRSVGDDSNLNGPADSTSYLLLVIILTYRRRNAVITMMIVTAVRPFGHIL